MRKIQTLYDQNFSKYDFQGDLNNKLIAKKVLNINPLNLQFLPDELRNDEEVVMHAVKKEGLMLKYASDNIKSENFDIISAAINQNPMALKFVSDNLKYLYPGILDRAVEKKGSALKFVPQPFQTRELVLKALKSDGDAVKYILNQNLKSDQGIILMAMRYYSRIDINDVNYALCGYIDDKEVKEVAVKKNWENLKFYKNSLFSSDYHIILTALKQSTEASDYIPERLIQINDNDWNDFTNRLNSDNPIDNPIIKSDLNRILLPLILNAAIERDYPDRIKDNLKLKQFVKSVLRTQYIYIDDNNIVEIPNIFKTISKFQQFFRNSESNNESNKKDAYKTIFNVSSKDICEIIFQYLTLKDLITISNVCKKLYMGFRENLGIKERKLEIITKKFIEYLIETNEDKIIKFEDKDLLEKNLFPYSIFPTTEEIATQTEEIDTTTIPGSTSSIEVQTDFYC